MLGSDAWHCTMQQYAEILNTDHQEEAPTSPHAGVVQPPGQAPIPALQLLHALLLSRHT